MPSFSSAVINGSNIGTWDYYVMSDSTALWRGLNGLAAWMNGSGGVLQAGAMLGALICLAYIIYCVAIRQSSPGVATVGAWFIFMSSMGMTGTAQVVNIYTGATTVVANVPALALIPASMFSKAGYKVFTGMETAFQSTSGSYMAVSTNGFVGPLDLLLTLRSDSFPAAFPGLHRTLRQVVSDCALPFGGYPAGTPSMQNSLDILEWLKTYGSQSGITKTFPDNDANAAGEVVSCADGLNYVDTKYQAFAAGDSAFIEWLNTNSGKSSPTGTNGNWGSAATSNSFGALIGSISGVSQSAVKFTKNALVSSTVTGTIACLGNSGMMTSADTCATSALVTNEGLEAYKTNSALNASGFIKTMFTSMGFLQVLFFSLFPFVALYGLIVVSKTMSVFGSYILLGVWSQSWLLVVAPIQAYIQNNVIDELTRVIGTAGGMNLINQAAIYTSLSTKLAVASDMMANSQMLALALLSGSIYSLSSLVGNSSGAQHMDGSAVQKKMSNSSPLLETSAPKRQALNVNSANGDSMAMINDSTAATVTGIRSEGNTLGTASSLSDIRDATKRQGTSESWMKQELAKSGYSVDEQAKMESRISDTLGIVGQAGSGLITDSLSTIVAGLKGKGGAALTKPEQAAAMERLQGAQGAAVNQLAAKDPTIWSRFNSSDPAVRQAAQFEVASKAVDLASDAGTVIAVGSAIASAGTLSGPALAGAVALQGSKKLMKDKLKEGIARMATKEAVGGAAVVASAEAGRSALRGMASGFGEVLTGNLSVIGKAAHEDVFGHSNTVGSTRGFGRDSAESGSLGASFEKARSESKKQSFDQTAASTSTSIVSLGTSLDSRANALSKQPDSRTQLLANEQKIRKSGAPASMIARADALVDTAMGGYQVRGKDGAEITKAMRAELFSQFMEGQKGNGLGGPEDNKINGLTEAVIPNKAEPSEASPPPAAAKANPNHRSVVRKDPEPSLLTQSMRGQAPKVADDTVEARVGRAADNLTSIFTGSSSNAAKLAQAPVTGTFVATKGNAQRPQGGYELGAVSVKYDPTFGMGPSPSDTNRKMPTNQTMTDGDAIKFVSNNGKMVNFADAASNRQERQMARGSNARDTLNNSALSDKYEEDQATREKVVAASIGIIGGMEMVGGALRGFGSGGQTQTQTPGTSGGTAPSTPTTTPAEKNQENRQRTVDKAEKFRARKR